ERDDRLAAGGDREIQPRQAADRARPRPGGDHYVAHRNLAPGRPHAPDVSTARVDGDDGRRLAQIPAELGEAAGGTRRHLVGAPVPGAWLVDDGRALGDPEVRAQLAHLVGPDHARLDADLLVHAEGALDAIPALGRAHEEHAGAHEAGLAAHLVGPALEDP